MQRRQLLQAGSTLGALGLVSGCASIGGNRPKVVVVGAGYAGATGGQHHLNGRIGNPEQIDE